MGLKKKLVVTYEFPAHMSQLFSFLLVGVIHWIYARLARVMLGCSDLCSVSWIYARLSGVMRVKTDLCSDTIKRCG